MYPPEIQKLIEKFSQFPTVGPRTASRFVFYLLSAPKHEIQELLHAINNLQEKIKTCAFCFNPHEGKGNLCEICSSLSRKKDTLCLVEKEIDLSAIEKTKKYHGIYFILGGNVSALRKQDIEKIRIGELEERLKNPSQFLPGVKSFSEVIIATNSTAEGESTALLLQRKLKEICEKEKIKLTRLARGMPSGGELEYADEETLASAFEGRK